MGFKMQNKIVLYCFAIIFQFFLLVNGSRVHHHDNRNTSAKENPKLQQVSPPVTLTVTSQYVVIDNGIVQLSLTNPTGSMFGVKYNGIDNLLEPLQETQRGYWDTMWNGKFDTLLASKFSVIAQDDNKVEVSFQKIHDPLNGNNPPLNVDKRYVMLRGSSGFYSYGIFQHLKGWSAVNLDEARIAIKLSKSLFHFMAISDDRQRIMPTEEDRASGQTLDYREAVKITNPSNPRLKDEVDDKYQYTDEIKILNYEYCNGGPMKQDLTSHVGPTSMAVSIYIIFFSGHYAGPQLGVSLTNGEAWTKVFGPVFFYVNSDSSNDHTILWEDAKRQMNEETNKWPYDFPASVDYLHANQRGSVSGQLMVHDWYINVDPLPALNAYIGLAEPGLVGSWQSETKGYQFWTQIDDSGNFKINNVRPGIYGVYSWVPGVMGDYKFSSYITVTQGKDTYLGQIIFETPRKGPPLWEIGFPDRTANEFFIPDPLPGLQNYLYTNTTIHKFRQYGLWDRYVWINTPSKPRPWFDSSPIGMSNAIARHGIHGLYMTFDIEFPGTQLYIGENIIYLKQASVYGPFTGL
ncbi:hypothetical protein H5410_054361, partial [Solanum commersonii]